ncbi:hypothetical protein B0J18DRAFT_234057 [Chaetomium sp. MPI-SDFR-AT-0129]|uniref:Uncharacterized protein n=1 Tax=Dichotomopilus funicola TaxID=1934379 RepID=A0AAN6UVA5_9PEZI|nr:hypothetical protein B0J18DRAFT_234057 [Chaetomium sp. MPI-SDFR-AT-0129]KAK4139579.1 hypothetical protein C8A04DRAFT_40590 [Dichotomopilus funicola]
MHAATTLLFIAGLAGTALGAATKMYDDENCTNEVDKKVYNGLSLGDAPLTDNIKSIKTDAVFDTWYAYQDSDGDKCKGDLLTSLKDGDCIKVADLGIGCTRICSAGIGTSSCAVTHA